MSIVLIILSLICAALAVNMLFSKSPITAALSLLGVLIMTAGIYGLIGEHLVATLQLVVYAGAIMVLFIFSIMLLNLNVESTEQKDNPGIFYTAIAVGLGVFGLLVYSLTQHFSVPSRHGGPYTQDVVKHLGGNSKVLSHALFSQFYVSFEVISLALLVAIVGAVVLAKRKFD